MKPPGTDLELLRAAPLVTGRFQTWRPGDGVPIRSTVGEFKGWRYGPLEYVRSLAPFGLMGKDLAPEEFDVRYRDRLDHRSAHILDRLAAIARKHPGQPLVVLCFEDVWAGQGCHRRLFAEWMLERHGLEVPELGGPEVAEVSQLPLF